MPSIFGVLDFEERLQLGDKTRMDASKTFVTPLGTTATTTATITPGANGSAQNVFSANAEDNYLDWIFNTWNFDIVTGFNDKIDFDQAGEKVATIAPGTYLLSQLLTEMASKLNAVSGITGTFTCTSDTDDKITITNSTTSFTLLPYGDNKDTSLLPLIGFASRTANKYQGASVVGKPVEYGLKKVTLAVGNGSLTDSVIKYIKLYSKPGDALFSSDQDLTTWEPDIMQWVKNGRSSYLDIHREAQDQILYWFDKEGYINVYQEKYDKFDLIDISEINEWSAFLTLSIIFWGISNKVDDVFLKKHYEYVKKAQEARNRAVIRLDVNEDGQIDIGEELDIKFGTVVTR